MSRYRYILYFSCQGIHSFNLDANSRKAALSAFPATSRESPILNPYPTIPSVFKAVQSATCTNGVIPFENSTNGSVVASLDLFVDAEGQYQNVEVVGEQYVKVEHCLLGHRAASNSNSTPDFSLVTDVYTHPQAWTQCSIFLSTHLHHARRHDVSSTSAAAALVAADVTGASVAISSAMAAKAHNVPILQEGVEDRGDNVTRFFVLGRKHDDEGARMPYQWRSDTKIKSLVTFTLHAHDNPGALAEALAAFKPYGINITGINERPSGAGPWRYCFLVETLTTNTDTRERDPPLNSALRELGNVVKSWRWCGSWESGLG